MKVDPSYPKLSPEGLRLDVPEVLNVHVNENLKKNLLFLEEFFFQAVKN